MGVWIEMTLVHEMCHLQQVTPLVGVWIEMSSSACSTNGISVTPLVGVWIEISQVPVVTREAESHAPRGRVD